MATASDTKPKPIVWWFTRGAGSAIKIPVFLLLAAGTVGAFFQGGIQTLAYVKVMRAAWGWLGFVAFLFIWPFSLLMPGWLWWAAIKNTPSIYLKESAASSNGRAVEQFIFNIVFLFALSTFMQWGHAKIIGWIADQNPAAVYRTGATGSRPPSSSQNGN